MPSHGDTHPDDETPTCPEWGEWLDDRHVAVRCRGCDCVYTVRSWSVYKRPTEGWTGGIPKACKVCADRRRDEARKALPIDRGLVEAVKRHALAHYNEDGWDFIVECYTDADLWEVIAGAKTEAAAVKKARAAARLLGDRRGDVRATAW